MPKYDGGPVSRYFTLLCFYVGLGILTLFCLGQFEVDDREGPGFNPFSKMPDGRLGISEFFVTAVGLVFFAAATSLVSWLISEAKS